MPFQGGGSQWQGPVSQASHVSLDMALRNRKDLKA
ncbi:unnamed protein product [Ectocarpus sp. CCAP 1310/34]|nr:unnamed protein product [Ectocarpus sp. CCAP 1310/34]